MAPDDGTDWLLALLTEIQLEQFYLKIRDELHVTRLGHFDYVKPADLDQIGMGRPGQRRLEDAIKRRKQQRPRPKSWVYKVSLHPSPIVTGTLVSEGGKIEPPSPSLHASQIMLKLEREGARLECPEDCPRGLYSLQRRCWAHNPEERPHFRDIIGLLHELRPREVRATQDLNEPGWLRLETNDLITVIEGR
nr:non-receptor tyrosine-protein kinase TNK1 [Chelonoidis abingdonii]